MLEKKDIEEESISSDESNTESSLEAEITPKKSHKQLKEEHVKIII
jgi:hypothetical protein